MSLSLPRIRLRSFPRHRAVDRIRHLEHQLEGAGYLIRGLTTDRDAFQALYEAAAPKANRVDAAEAEARDLRAENGQLRAELANLHAVTVPPAERDIEPGDEATQPIPCGGYWADPSAWRNRGITDVIPLHQRGPEAA